MSRQRTMATSGRRRKERLLRSTCASPVLRLGTDRRVDLGEEVLLLAEGDLAHLGVPQEHLVVEALGEQLLTVLPHLVQLLPADHGLQNVSALASIFR